MYGLSMNQNKFNVNNNKRVNVKRNANTKAIRIALIDSGTTQRSIAIELGVSFSLINQVIYGGQGASHRVYEAIAKACGKTIDELFPPIRSNKEHQPETTKKEDASDGG